MDDPQAKRSLVDDPNFLASLGDLDRGLGSEDEEPPEMPVRRTVPPRPARPAPPPQPPPISTRATRAATPALPRHAPAVPHLPPPPLPRVEATPFPLPPIAREPGARRPLLDLFPPERERPPGPLPGTATGPQIPRGPAKHSAPPATPGLESLTYEMFYGLNEKPFSLSADPRFLYHSTSHDEVAQRLLTAIARHDGLVLVTGEIGLGKTMLARVVIDQLDRRTLTSVVLESLESMDELLKTILVDFGVVSRADLARAPEAATREALSAALNTFLESLGSLQASAVVILDEAQNLPVDLLQQLPAISEAGEHARTLQIVLLGQPSLTSLLRQSELRLLNEEVAVRAQLGPLAGDEVGDYVMHRLGVAGSSPRVEFDAGARTRMYELSGGVPRVVNLLCDRALSRGYDASASVIDAALIEAAAQDLGLGPPAYEGHGVVRTLLTAFAMAFFMTLGAVGALWVFRDAVARTILQWENVPLPPTGPVRRLPVPLRAIPPPADDFTASPRS